MVVIGAAVTLLVLVVCGIVWILVVSSESKVSVEVISAKVCDYALATEDGRQMVPEPRLVITIKLQNLSTVRVITVESQVTVAKLTDEFGNTYPELHPKDDYRRPSPIRLEPQERYPDPPGPRKGIASEVLVFDRPVAGAGVLILTLSGLGYGRRGTIEMKIPPYLWQPVK
jgi:hypothetical protein